MFERMDGPSACSCTPTSSVILPHLSGSERVYNAGSGERPGYWIIFIYSHATFLEILFIIMKNTQIRRLSNDGRVADPLVSSQHVPEQFDSNQTVGHKEIGQLSSCRP